MKAITKYLLFILDELLLLIFIIALLIFYNASVTFIISATIILIIVLSFITYIFLPQLKQPMTGSEGLIGKKAKALETFDDQGTILIHGEQWNAITHHTPIEEGDEVIIVDVNGLTLTVEKKEKRK